MTEQQIEARAERLMDSLDRRLMSGEISQAQYDHATASLDRNVNAMCDAARVKVADAVRLLGDYTGGRYDLWALAGPAKAAWRQQIMGHLQGRKATKAESGVTMLRAAFYALCNPPAGTLHAQEMHFVEWCKAQEGRA